MKETGAKITADVKKNKKMKKISDILAKINLVKLPKLDEIGIEKMPTKQLKVEKEHKKTTFHHINNGQIHRTTIEGTTSETIIGTPKANTSNEINLDAFDFASLDYYVGVKWKKHEDRAIIMKWHWMNSMSASAIEKFHTDKASNTIERGFSERTAAEYIKAFYEADNEREKQNKPRLKNAPKSNVIDF